MGGALPWLHIRVTGCPEPASGTRLKYPRCFQCTPRLENHGVILRRESWTMDCAWGDLSF